MITIAFTQTKGGTGKSTLAASFSIWLHDQGVRVALLDTDPQQTAARWVRAAEPGMVVVVATTVNEIRQATARLSPEIDFLVADTPGAATDAAHAVTLMCDLAIVPLQPSLPDVSAIGEALKFIRLGQQMTHGARPKALLVLNLTAKGDLQARRLRAELAQQGLPLAQAEVRRLNALRDACDGSVTRSAAPQAVEAARDLSVLFREILGQLHQPTTKEVAHV